MDRADRLGSEVLGRLEGCPEADRLQAFVDGTLDAAQADPIREHLPACRACSVARAVLKDTHPSAAGEIPRLSPQLVEGTEALMERLAAEAETAGSGPVSPLLLKAAAAVALLISLALASYLWLGAGQPGRGLGELRGAQALDILEPEGELAAAPAAFRWNPHPLAGSYRVLLFDEEMNQVWSAESEGTESEMPLDPEAVRRVEPGEWLVWQVVALDEIDGEIGRSPAAHFRVKSDRP